MLNDAVYLGDSNGLIAGGFNYKTTRIKLTYVFSQENLHSSDLQQISLGQTCLCKVKHKIQAPDNIVV